MVALPDVFLPYQQRLWRAIDQHQVVVVEKSRRTGYSWALGYIAAGMAAMARDQGGTDVLYMGYEKDMTREFIDYVGDAARVFQLAASDVEEVVFSDPDKPEASIQAFRIQFASGFKVMALPSVARALRGKQGFVILDEAAFMDDLGAVLKAALALRIWGDKIVIVSTHNGDANPFNTLIQDVRGKRLPYHLERLTFEEALSEGLYKRICLRNGNAWSPEGEATWRAQILAEYGTNADEELHVIPSAGSGTWLSGAVIEARMQADIPVLRLELPRDFVLQAEHIRKAEIRDWCEEHLRPVLATLDPDTPHAFGWDFGRYHDLSVLWPLAIGKDLVRRTPFVLELRGVPSEEQEWILFYVLDRLPRLRGGKMDAGGQGFTTAENTMKRYGARIEMVTLTEPWYRENMPPLKAAFEDAMIVVPQDREIVDDLRLVRLVRGIARVPDLRTGAPGKKRHGDAAIAGALAYAASRAEPEEYGYEAASPAAIGAARRGHQADPRPTARRELRGAL
jgi:phage FluMu gp28-like protein